MFWYVCMHCDKIFTGKLNNYPSHLHGYHVMGECDREALRFSLLAHFKLCNTALLAVTRHDAHAIPGTHSP